MSTAAKKSGGTRPRVVMLVDESRPHLSRAGRRVAAVVEQHVEVVALEDFNGELPSRQYRFCDRAGWRWLDAPRCPSAGVSAAADSGGESGASWVPGRLQPELPPELLPQIAAGEYRVISHSDVRV